MTDRRTDRLTDLLDDWFTHWPPSAVDVNSGDEINFLREPKASSSPIQRL